MIRSTEFKYLISYDRVLYYALNEKLRSNKDLLTGFRRINEVKKCIARISRDTGLPYPAVRIIPEALILTAEEEGVNAIVYANVNYSVASDGVYPVIDLYLPTLLYTNRDLSVRRKVKLKGSDVLLAILAHELIHYVYLAIKYITADYMTSLAIYTGDLMGKLFIEKIYQVPPNKLFRSRKLIKLVSNIDDIIEKYNIARYIERYWIKKGKPVKIVHFKDFKVSIPISLWTAMHFPESVLSKARDLINETRNVRSI